MALVASAIIAYTASIIYSSSVRIRKKFTVEPMEAVRLDDLTQPPYNGDGSNGISGGTYRGSRYPLEEKDSLL